MIGRNYASRQSCFAPFWGVRQMFKCVSFSARPFCHLIENIEKRSQKQPMTSGPYPWLQYALQTFEKEHLRLHKLQHACEPPSPSKQQNRCFCRCPFRNFRPCGPSNFYKPINFLGPSNHHLAVRYCQTPHYPRLSESRGNARPILQQLHGRVSVWYHLALSFD